MKSFFKQLPFAIILISLGINTGLAADSSTQIPMHSKGTVTYYVSGYINNTVASDFLVDTGSGYVTINTSTLKKLNQDGGAEFVKKISAVMADGSETVVSVYRLATLKLSDSCIIQDVEAAVMPGSTPNILGLSALKKVAPFSMSMSPPSLTLSGCDTGNVIASN